MDSFTARVSRDGKWWMIQVPTVGLTQARRLSEVERTARELIAVTLDKGPDSFDVFVEVDEVLEGLHNRLASIQSGRNQAEVLEQEATAEARRLAKDLNAIGIPLRDIGEVLGVSHQRAHQLIGK